MERMGRRKKLLDVIGEPTSNIPLRRGQLTRTRPDDAIRDRVGSKPGLRGRDSVTVIARLSSLSSPLAKGENYHTKSSNPFILFDENSAVEYYRNIQFHAVDPLTHCIVI